MDFQAAPIEHEPIDASFDVELDTFAAMDGALDQHLDSSMDAAMDAAKDAADAVDDLVQHLTATEAVDVAAPLDFVSNESASEAEPVIEEIVQQVQKSLEVPFLLITCTLVLGLIVIFAMFLRQRYRRSNSPKSMPVEEPVEEEEVAESPSAEVAAAEDVEVTSTEVEKAAVEEAVDEEVVAVVEEVETEAVTSGSEACEEDIPCVAAAEPEFEALASACPIETDLAASSSL